MRAFEPRPKAASRSTRWIHSAPPACQSRAATTGSPYEVSEPASPWTRRTAWPSATSTAGRSSSRGAASSVTGSPRSRGGHSVPTQLRSSARPAGPDFSGWNCVAESGPFSTAATNRSLRSGVPAVRPGYEGRGRRPAGSVGEGEGAGRVRVDEVEALALDAAEEDRIGGRIDARPPHVGDHRARRACRRPRATARGPRRSCRAPRPSRTSPEGPRKSRGQAALPQAGAPRSGRPARRADPP